MLYYSSHRRYLCFIGSCSVFHCLWVCFLSACQRFGQLPSEGYSSENIPPECSVFSLRQSSYCLLSFVLSLLLSLCLSSDRCNCTGLQSDNISALILLRITDSSPFFRFTSLTLNSSDINTQILRWENKIFL